MKLGVHGIQRMYIGNGNDEIRAAAMFAESIHRPPGQSHVPRPESRVPSSADRFPGRNVDRSCILPRTELL